MAEIPKNNQPPVPMGAPLPPASFPPGRYPPPPCDTHPQEISSKTLGGMLGGLVGGFLGWIGAETYIHAKTWHFEGEVDKFVKDAILNRKTSLGAAADSLNTAVEHVATPLGNFGIGTGSHALRQGYAYELANSGKYPLVKFIQQVGRAPITLAAAGVGALIGYIGYKAVAPKGTPLPPGPVAFAMPAGQAEDMAQMQALMQPRQQDWAAKVEAAPASAHTKGA